MRLFLFRSWNYAVKHFLSSVYLAAIGSFLFCGLCTYYLLASSDTESKETTILLWVHPFKHHYPIYNCAKEFNFIGCSVTDNRSMYNQADIVIIHHRSIRLKLASIPDTLRPPAQHWAWFNHESPTFVRQVKPFDNTYNLTFSYREDSDISVPYGFLIPNVFLGKVKWGPEVYPLDRISPSALHRPSIAAWVVSHKSNLHQRMIFYNILKEYIQVDVFGGGGGIWLGLGRDKLVQVVKNYQFYLALENSQHTDYITEKLWNAVLGGAIPVVLGPSRQNYERFLPPEAFIHVDDFPTVKDLAEYMLKVKDSPSMIEQHLSWRTSYSVVSLSSFGVRYCMACLADKTRTNVVKNLSEWFISE